MESAVTGCGRSNDDGYSMAQATRRPSATEEEEENIQWKS